MRTTFLATAISTLALTTSAAFADAPSVAVDIAPTHSLVAKVMEGVGSPDLIVQPGASPHGYSLRPAEAQALQEADIVFWVSEGLAPWIKDSIDSLAGDARSVELMETEGTTKLEFREGATFEAHSHDHGDHDHETEEGHAHESHDHHDHAHTGDDPHAWLDPQNARVWLDVIASNLAELDPENADTYKANAAGGKEELETLISEVNAELDRFRGTNFIVFHDAYQYFENRFGISATGSIKLGDASDPSPARVTEIRDKVAKLDIVCAFAEPQFNPGLVETIFQGADAKVGILDPLGSDLELGPDLYPQLIRNLADNLNSCL